MVVVSAIADSIRKEVEGSWEWRMTGPKHHNYINSTNYRGCEDARMRGWKGWKGCNGRKERRKGGKKQTTRRAIAGFH
jgi:hypothetical protein